MIEVLMSGYVTMGKKVLEFEKKFAKYLGVKYAIMVNSGSSANLLAMSAATNLSKKNRLKKGDKILVPAVCWSTSVWPILQCGLIPVFVDVSIETMNIDLLDLKEKLKDDIKGIVLVHILGNCTNMDELMKIVKENNLFLLEDTCESLGSKFDDKFLGTFGNFGCFCSSDFNFRSPIVFWFLDFLTWAKNLLLVVGIRSMTNLLCGLAPGFIMKCLSTRNGFDKSMTTRDIPGSSRPNL